MTDGRLRGQSSDDVFSDIVPLNLSLSPGEWGQKPFLHHDTALPLWRFLRGLRRENF